MRTKRRKKSQSVPNPNVSHWTWSLMSIVLAAGLGFGPYILLALTGPSQVKHMVFQTPQTDTTRALSSTENP
jgi:hypothetical protein